MGPAAIQDTRNNRDRLVNTNERLLLATRIHFGLMRHLGEGIDVARMLNHESEAREVLWAVEALGDAELQSLGRQFAQAAHVPVAPVQGMQATPGRAAQDDAWAAGTSGFGVSRPADLAEPAPAQGWFKPARWLRGASPRSGG